jgi:REP-associated tyrosine transposase
MPVLAAFLSWPHGPDIRMEYEAAVYHLMSRGDRREPIFKDDADRVGFLEVPGWCCVRTGW